MLVSSRSILMLILRLSLCSLDLSNRAPRPCLFTHSHSTLTHSLSLVLVVMMRSKEFKTSRSILMLILSFSSHADSLILCMCLFCLYLCLSLFSLVRSFCLSLFSCTFPLRFTQSVRMYVRVSNSRSPTGGRPSRRCVRGKF